MIVKIFINVVSTIPPVCCTFYNIYFDTWYSRTKLLISKIKREIRYNFATKRFIHLTVGGGKVRNLRNIGSRSSRVNINSIVFLACLPARRYAVRKNEVGPFRLVTRCIEIWKFNRPTKEPGPTGAENNTGRIYGRDFLQSEGYIVKRGGKRALIYEKVNRPSDVSTLLFHP